MAYTNVYGGHELPGAVGGRRTYSDSTGRVPTGRDSGDSGHAEIGISQVRDERRIVRKKTHMKFRLAK